MPDVVDRDWVRSAAPHSIGNFFSRLTYRSRFDSLISRLVGKLRHGG